MLYIVVEEICEDGSKLRSVSRFRDNKTMAKVFNWSEKQCIELLLEGTVTAPFGGAQARYTMQHTLPADAMCAANSEFAMTVEERDGKMSDFLVKPLRT